MLPEPKITASSVLSTRGLGERAGGRQKAKHVGTTRATLPAPKAKPKAEDAAPNPRLQAFENWLSRPELGAVCTYWVGELGRDCEGDAQVAELAEFVRGVAVMNQEIVSECGHPRHFVEGRGLVELVVKRGLAGEQHYIARRRPAAPAES